MCLRYTVLKSTTNSNSALQTVNSVNFLKMEIRGVVIYDVRMFLDVWRAKGSLGLVSVGVAGSQVTEVKGAAQKKETRSRKCFSLQDRYFSTTLNPGVVPLHHHCGCCSSLVFNCQAPVLWNQLPVWILESTIISIFKVRPKTSAEPEPALSSVGLGRLPMMYYPLHYLHSLILHFG